MAEFNIAMYLRAKNEASGPIKQVKEEITGTGTAAKQATGSVRGLEASTAELAQTSKRAAAEARAMKQAQDELARAKARTMNATRQLGVQVNDFGTQIATGSGIAQAFSAQIGQVGFAMADMGGRMGAVGRVLQGPWGAAISLASFGLSGLIGQLMGAGDASEKAGKGADKHKDAAKALADAIRDLDKATAKQILTSRQAMEAAYDEAKAMRQREIDTRSATRASLQDALTRIDLNRQRIGVAANDPRIAAPLRSQIAFDEAAAADFRKKIAEQTGLIVSAENSMKRLLAPISERRVEERLDATAAAAGRYEDTLGRLRQELARTGNSAAFERGLEAAKRKLTSDTAAIAKAREKVRAPTASGRDLDLEGDVDARLRGIGARVTSGYRSREHNRRVGGALNSYHITGQARDIAKTAGVTMASIRGALNGLDIKELIDEGDHFHVAWGGALRGVSKEAKDAAKEIDATAKAALDLDRIFRELASGFTPEKVADALGSHFEREQAELKKLRDGIGASLDPKFADEVAGMLEDAGREGGEAFRGTVLDAADELSRVLGGKLGGLLGNFISRLQDMPQQQAALEKLGKTIGRVLSPGDRPGDVTAAQRIGGRIGAAIPAVSLGLAVNSAVGKLLGNGQIKNGGLLNILIGPFATAAFGKALKGSATISGVDGISTKGNSKSRISAASGLAGNVQGALEQISEALGGTIGSFSGSIGVRKKKFVVDPTGKGRTKGAGVQKFDNEADAQSALLRDAIADGAVQGLSAAVRKAIGSNSNLDKALREALKVQEVEDLMSEIGGSMGRQFRDFNRQAQERVRIARQYGFDVVKIEERNAKDRAKMIDEVLGNRVGALKDLIADLDFGDLFEGSMADRRNRLITEIEKAQKDAEAGVDGAGNKLAGLNRNLIDLSRDAYGTAGGEFGADLARARTGAERVIELESARVRAAADAAKATNDKLEENNDQNAEMISHLRVIAANTTGLGISGGGGGGGGVNTGREVNLR